MTQEVTLSLPICLSGLCAHFWGTPQVLPLRGLSHSTVPVGRCTLWSTRLETKLLQPRGCMMAQQCGHGKSKPPCCALGSRFTRLWSASSSSCLKYPSLTCLCSWSKRAKRVLPHLHSYSDVFWLLTEKLLYLIQSAGESQCSQDCCLPPPGLCMHNGLGFGSWEFSDVCRIFHHCHKFTDWLIQ